MQAASVELRNQLWGKLEVIFNKYSSSNQGIQTRCVEEIVKDVLGQTSQMQIDYVVKNMFRIDVDQNGTVDLLEFGNFLFKRHCGQMSLQKMHRSNLLKNGNQRKILPDQFVTLLNKAYAFLGVSCEKDIALGIFQQADSDKDGLITYVQYFRFIDKYVCQTRNEFSQEKKVQVIPAKKKPVVDQGRKWNSKLRMFLWKNLRKLYDTYISSKTLSVNDQDLRGLIHAILGNISEMQMVFLLNGLFKLDSTTIQFAPFAIIFIYLVCELGLSRFQKNHQSTKRSINRDQFLIILQNTFKFLSILRIKKQILFIIFQKIDKNKDKLITFDQFMDWAKKYLAVVQNRGDEFYSFQDDDSNNGQSITNVQMVPKDTNDNMKTKKSIIRFKFISYELAQIVRKRIYQLLIPYDRDNSRLLGQIQIRTALKQILHQNQLELDYVTRNVFRYDKNGDGRVTFTQFINFSVQQHFGQMSIQRLHRKKNYSRGLKRQMNLNQFQMTINHALSYIDIRATPEQIKQIYQVFGTQWITYEIYFVFLREYFGSLSPITKIQVMNGNKRNLSPDQQYIQSLNNLSPMDRFIRMIIDQLSKIFYRYDFDGNKSFSFEQIQAILLQVFQLSQTQISFVLITFFRMESRKGQQLSFDELVNILLQVYLVEILMKRKYPNISPSQWKLKKINVQEFILFFIQGCFFLRLKPQRSDLTIVFKIIDTDKDGYITFQQYFDFIQKYLCGDYQLPAALQSNQKSLKDNKKSSDNNRHNQVPNNVSKQQWQFIQQIWAQLRQYFDNYDIGKKQYLIKEEFKQFVIEVLDETTESQLDYIFLNMSRIDINHNNQTQFFEFAPFILNHAGQISLQKFHKQQIKGKKTLTENELYIIFCNAYSFLKTISKGRDTITNIYKRIGGGKEVSYGSYLGWIHRALARKFL